MAKKAAKKVVSAKKVSAKAPAKRGSEVRNSPVPKKVAGGKGSAPAATPKREVTWEMISKRAHEIARSEHAGSDLDNWLRAERELHGA